MQKVLFRYNVILLSALLAGGCATTNSPPNVVAGNFWQALVNEDMPGAQALATNKSRSLVALPELKWRQAEVNFGEMRVRESDADIDTSIRLTTHKDPTIKPFEFKTYLEKEQDQWRIEYSKTRNSLSLAQQSGLKNLVGELQGLSSQLSEKMGKTLQGLQKEIPKVEKQVEDIGSKLNGEIENAIETLGPAIKKSLDEFTNAIEGALEKPKQKPDSHQTPELDNSI